MKVNSGNIIPVAKVTIITFFLHKFKVFSKIIIEGQEIMERTTSILSVEGQPTEAVSAQTSIVFRAVFWVVLPCKLIVDRRFRGAYCLHHQG
jgi:hypothetical protein